MLNDDIAKLPEAVILAIRVRSFVARADVDLSDLRVLSRVLNNAMAEGTDVSPLMTVYAGLVDDAIGRPASCWSADTRSIYEAIWPFMASSYVLNIRRDHDLPVAPTVIEFTQFAREWIAAREAETAMPTDEADRLIRVEMERVRELFPRLGMSYGYIGNCNLFGGPAYDDRSFRVFTQVKTSHTSTVTHSFGGFPTARLTKMHTQVMAGLENWARELNAQLESGATSLRSTSHLKAA